MAGSAAHACIVWVPILVTDTRAAAERAAARFSDPALRHFWDADRALARELGDRLAIPPRGRATGHGLAWDVYLVYGREAHWRPGPPPLPAFWMHQLGQVPQALAPPLDGAVLHDRLAALAAPAARP
jgi:hypothetical protein